MKTLSFTFLIISISLLLVACQGVATQGKTVENTASDASATLNEKSKADDHGTSLGINSQEVTYSTDSTTLKGYIAYPLDKAANHPGVLIVHEWWGHNDYVRKRADQLAELGYTAFALDMYGDGKQAAHPDDAGRFAGMVMQNIDVAEAHFDAALKVLKDHPSVYPDHIAAVGYCFGGSVVLTMADAGKELDAVAAFHSGVDLPIMPTKDLKARVLVMNGAEDPFISEESVHTFEHQLDSVGATYEYISIPGATHAYTNKEATAMGREFGLPLAYNAEADALAWEKLKELLSEVF